MPHYPARGILRDFADRKASLFVMPLHPIAASATIRNNSRSVTFIVHQRLRVRGHGLRGTLAGRQALARHATKTAAGPFRNVCESSETALLAWSKELAPVGGCPASRWYPRQTTASRRLGSGRLSG